MSVLIKGLEMPRHCTECLFCKRSYDEAMDYVDFICIVDGTTCKISSCPLIPIPDHGDLADRDEFIGKLQSWALLIAMGHGDDDEWVKCIGEVCKRLYNAPVVIPTERNVKVCPLYSDDEVTEYCLEGPCTAEMEGRCPIAERNEDETD